MVVARPFDSTLYRYICCAFCLLVCVCVCVCVCVRVCVLLFCSVSCLGGGGRVGLLLFFLLNCGYGFVA